MNHFISKQSIYRKSGVMMLIVLGLVAGLYWYSSAKNLTYVITSLKPYYWHAYAIGLESRILGSPVGSPEGDASRKARSIPVLVYHSLLDKPDDQNVTFKNFKDQLYALKAAGYQTITMQDFYDFMRGIKTLPDRSFMITFDDGRKDSYYPADPILRALGYQATMAIIVDFTKEESGFYLTIEEIQNMLKSGRWDIISHGKYDHSFYPIDAQGTKGHFLANKLWIADQDRLENDQEYVERITKDLRDSKYELEQMFHVPMLGFALPFSDWGQGETNYPRAQEILLPAMAQAYPFSFYEMWIGGNFLANYSQSFGSGTLAKRILVQPTWNGNDVLHLLEAIRAKDPEYPEGTLPGSMKGWTRNWGDSGYAGNNLHIASRPDSTGGSLFLDGSYDWKNYRIDATADWIKGNSVMIQSRLQDDKNYVACVFSPDRVQIQQSLEGVQRIIKGVNTNVGRAPKSDFSMGMMVNGRTVQCMMNDTVMVSSTFLDPSLSHGGIGFKTWDPLLGNSELLVKKISIAPVH